MKRTRVEIKMTFSADLDPVKGWLDHPNDWAVLLEQRIGASAGPLNPYNMKLSITDINCRDASQPVCTEDDGSNDPVYPAQLEENEATNEYVSDNGQFGVGA